MAKRLIAELIIRGTLKEIPEEDIITYQEQGYLFTCPQIRFYGTAEGAYAVPDVDEILPNGIGENEDFTIECEFQ